MGKSAGIKSLRATLEMMHPQHKPTDLLNPKTEQLNAGVHQAYSKLSEVPDEEIRKLRDENPAEYARLYKAEYGVNI